MKEVFLAALARDDLVAAQEWYERGASGLADRFLDHFQEVAARIAENPLQFPAVEGPIRRALLRPFPYGVFFLERDSDVLIIAVVHLHRDPGTWLRRS